MMQTLVRSATSRRAVPVLTQQRLLSGGKPPKPSDARFGSGPTKKRPGWSLDALSGAAIGRSHRSKLGKAKLQEAIEESKRILGLPEGYELGIVPGSNTGAFEMAMWSVLGARPIDLFQFESFSRDWGNDVVNQLKLESKTELHSAEYGELPDLSKARKEADLVFAWNGTTSGVRMPNADWIASDREGLTLCDATSAVFAMEMPWEKLDITTYSFQKVLGGEGAHGVVILSPHAIERLETYTPPWPMPKIFRMTKKGKLNADIFKGSTINTPSLLVIEDYLDALRWADQIGGLKQLVALSEKNLQIVKEFVDKNSWASFLAKDPSSISSTSICLCIDNISKDGIKKMTSLLEEENVAVDIGSYRAAPPGLRIWGGATVDPEDMKKLMPWIEYAYEQCKSL